MVRAMTVDAAEAAFDRLVGKAGDSAGGGFVVAAVRCDCRRMR